MKTRLLFFLLSAFCLLAMANAPQTQAGLSTMGDANGDGTVNATDIVEVVNYIMGSPSGTFNMEAADVNRDGTINAADIVGIVSIIMAPPSARYSLVIQFKDNKSITYSLSELPRITFTDTNLVITVNGKADNFPLNNVLRFVYTSGNKTRSYEIKNFMKL